jgi:hypothetical protein
MNRRILVTILIFTVATSVGLSSPKETAVDTVFSLIYNQQYQEADSFLEASGNKFDAFYTDILKLDLYWWRFVTTRSSDDSRQLNLLLKNFSTSGNNELDYRLKELITLSYRVRYEFKRYNIPGALIFRSKIKNLLAELNQEILPFSENRLKLFDLYNELFSYFDNVINPFFIENKRIERENALVKIERFTHDDDLIVATLARYFLGRIYMSIENDPAAARKYFRILSTQYPGNIHFSEYFATCNEKA